MPRTLQQQQGRQRALLPGFGNRSFCAAAPRLSSARGISGLCFAPRPATAGGAGARSLTRWFDGERRAPGAVCHARTSARARAAVQGQLVAGKLWHGLPARRLAGAAKQLAGGCAHRRGGLARAALVAAGLLGVCLALRRAGGLVNKSSGCAGALDAQRFGGAGVLQHSVGGAAAQGAVGALPLGRRCSQR